MCLCKLLSLTPMKETGDLTVADVSKNQKIVAAFS